MSDSNQPSARYQLGVIQQQWQDDPAQRSILMHLDRIHGALATTAQARWWQRWQQRIMGTQPISGLYLWGGVGRGKTFLVDLFFATAPTQSKLRLHFHRFMGHVHAALKKHAGNENPLRDVAMDFASQARLLCLDEFFVSDIGDAMILGRLLHYLFANHVILVTTSNIPAKSLYWNGLQREKFLPAIACIEQYCDVVELESTQDYRLRALTSAPVYHQPSGLHAEQALAACFERIAPVAYKIEAAIVINDRSIPIKRRAAGVIWFEFDAVCQGPRAVADYIELAQSFNSVLISNVPQFTSEMEDQARRFIHLVDEFYDRSVKLLLSAANSVMELYKGEKLRMEFSRTESRLIEMQSVDYLARPHRP